LTVDVIPDAERSEAIRNPDENTYPLLDSGFAPAARPGMTRTARESPVTDSLVFDRFGVLPGSETLHLCKIFLMLCESAFADHMHQILCARFHFLLAQAFARAFARAREILISS
jgi:hypothetical protein